MTSSGKACSEVAGGAKKKTSRNWGSKKLYVHEKMGSYRMPSFL
jgi:hypothetical protein